MSTTTGSPAPIGRSEVPWCGLAPFGPAATMTKSTLACPAVADRRGDVGGHLDLGPPGSQPLAHPQVHRVDGRPGLGERRDLRRGLADAQLAQHLAGEPLRGAGQRRAQGEDLLGPHPVGEPDRRRRAVEGGHDKGVRVGAVGVVDDAYAGGRRGDASAAGRSSLGTIERGRALGGQHQAGQPLPRVGVVAGQVAQVGAGGEQQRVQAGGGGGALRGDQPVRRVQLVGSHPVSLTVVWLNPYIGAASQKSTDVD